jgi:hypothetical protein
VRGSVIDAQGGRPPTHLDAEGFPGEGLLEDTLAEVAGEKKSIGAAGAESGQEAQLLDANILRLIDNGELGRWMRESPKFLGYPVEDAGVSGQ